MAITENQAQRVLLVRSIEQASNNEGIWTAEDAKEATLATKALAREKSAFDLFVVRRAELVIERIEKRNSDLVIDLSKRKSVANFGWILVVATFIFGMITDHFVADRIVSIIEWPIVGIIVWNLGIFTFKSLRYIWSLFRPSSRFGLWNQFNSCLADRLGRWQLGESLSHADSKTPAWIKRFENDWCKNCLTLNKYRVSLLFNALSTAIAISTLGSLYLRGLFKEYRAGWESTFISADTIHTIASVVLAPGAWIFNMKIPNPEHIAELRIPNSNGELAGDWIHLYAGSILVCVIIPRLVLLAIAGYSKSRMQHDFPLPLSSIYYTALRSVQAGYKAAVLTIPFRYELTAVMKSNLTKLLERAHGLSSTVTLEHSVMMGNDTSDWRSALHHEGYIAIFVIFNLAATAEQDTHGRVMQSILKESKGRAPVIAIVDTSSYPDQSDDKYKLRFSQRCDQWRQILDSVGCMPLFLSLLTLDQGDAQTSVEAVLYENN